jgi:uncharacterized membrane protein
MGLPRLERALAGVLHYGTWLASIVVSVGLALALIDWRAVTHGRPILPNMDIVTAGIALFILLPVLRVIVMLIAFLRERDYRFSAIATLVLMIIFLAFALGTRLPSAVAK